MSKERFDKSNPHINIGTIGTQEELTRKMIAIGKFAQTSDGEWSTPDKRKGFSWAYNYQQQRIDKVIDCIFSLEGYAIATQDKRLQMEVLELKKAIESSSPTNKEEN